jgi:hypothetical protein
LPRSGLWTRNTTPLTTYIKKSIVLDLVNNKRSLQDVETKTGIPYSQLWRWREQHRCKVACGGNDTGTFQLGAGAPYQVGDAGLELLVNTATATSSISDKSLRVIGAKSNIATNQLLLQAANLTSAGNGRAGVSVKMDPRTAAATLRRADASQLRKPRLLNPSREAAVSDPRMPISHAVFCHAMCMGRNSALLVNSDATHFIIQHEDKKTTVIFVSQGKGDEPRIATETTANDFAVKYILTISGNGGAAPGVFILSDDTLDPEEMKWKKVPFLSHDPSPDRYGYLVFLKSRSGNPKF